MLGCLPPECVAGTQEVPVLQALKCASQTTDRSPHIAIMPTGFLFEMKSGLTSAPRLLQQAKTMLYVGQAKVIGP